MLNTTRCLLRNLTANLGCRAQLRLLSSKKMAENPGGGCCDAGANKGEVCKPKKSDKKPPKTIGPAQKPKVHCMDDPCCPDPLMPYDEEFKHLLVHKERKNFQKTWRECPPRRVVQKVTCGEPEPEKPCPREKIELKAPPNDCKKQNPKCPKITMPGCKPAVQNAPYCKKWPKPANCEKIKCPYPSFSECVKPKIKPKHPIECDCLRLRGMCEVYKLLKSKGKLKIKNRKG